MDSHLAAYRNMIQTMKHSGLRIVGNMYTYDMASYFVTGGTDGYMTKYCIHME